MNLSIRLDTFRRVPPPVWWGAGLMAALAPFSANPGATLAAALLLCWLFLLLLRPGETPILLLVAGFQWLQACAKLLTADAQGVSLADLNQHSANLESATWLAMAAIAVLAAGMRLAIGRYDPRAAQQNQAQALAYSTRRAAVVYAWAVVISFAAELLAYRSPGLTQLALALAGAKWAAFFILAYLCLVRPRSKGLLVMAFLAELVVGFGGYFADFRIVFFVMLLAMVTAGHKLTPRRALALGGLAGVLLALSLAWTAVKVEYRAYLNEGSRSQVVMQSYGDRIEKLAEMVLALGPEELVNAIDGTVDRIAYVDFLGGVLVWVPEMVPHTGGEVWGAAVRHVLMPRLLFPGKPPLPNDSENTELFTGFSVAGDTSGTSVSIGYVGEAYVDFGLPWMFLPILAWGWLLGKLYSIIGSARTGAYILNQGLTITVLLHTVHFESNIAKALGGVLTAFIVAWVIQRYFANTAARLFLPARSAAAAHNRVR